MHHGSKPHIDILSFSETSEIHSFGNFKNELLWISLVCLAGDTTNLFLPCRISSCMSPAMGLSTTWYGNYFNAPDAFDAVYVLLYALLEAYYLHGSFIHSFTWASLTLASGSHRLQVTILKSHKMESRDNNKGRDTTSVRLYFILKSFLGKGIKALQSPYSELDVLSTRSQHLAPFQTCSLWPGFPSWNRAQFQQQPWIVLHWIGYWGWMVFS